MWKSLTLLAAVYSVFGTLATASPIDPQLDQEEAKVVASAGVPTQIFARTHIVVSWPESKAGIPWEEGWSVRSPADLADFAESLYLLYAGDSVFGYDPQKDPAAPSWARHRLVIHFIYDAKAEKWGGCWQSGMTISLCAPPSKGTRSWVGVLAHEMTHYFGANRFNQFGYTEGIADFMRYWSNRLLGWDDIAAELRRAYYDSCYSDGLPTYHGAAGALLEAYEKGGFTRIRDFIDRQRASAYETVFPPTWELFGLTGFKRASIAYCRNTRGKSAPAADSAEARVQAEVWAHLHGVLWLREIVDDLGSRQNDAFTRGRLSAIRGALDALQSAQLIDLGAIRAVADQLGTSARLPSSAVAQAQLALSELLIKLSQRAETILYGGAATQPKSFAGKPEGQPLSAGALARIHKLTPAGLSRLPPQPEAPPFAEVALASPRYLSLSQFQKEFGKELGSVFGVWLSGFLRVKAAGRYMIFLASDDGARLRLHESELIDNDGNHARKTRFAEVYLEPGLHPIQVGYYTAGGDANLQLDVVSLDGAADGDRGVEWLH